MTDNPENNWDVLYKILGVSISNFATGFFMGLGFWLAAVIIKG